MIHTKQCWSFPHRRKLCAYLHNSCIYYTDFHCLPTVLQDAFVCVCVCVCGDKTEQLV